MKGSRESVGSASEVSSIVDTDACSYLPESTVQTMAADAAEVWLSTGTSFGSWDYSTLSTNANAVEALQNGENWHNGSTWSDWYFPVDEVPSSLTGYSWPNMYHALGDVSGVHWFFECEYGSACYQGHCRTQVNSACSEEISATWIR